MADLHDLLVKTSRTFGLAIPFLPDETRRSVTIAYLLFRIADTFEDANLWPGARRVEALKEWEALLARPARETADQLSRRWLVPPPCDVPEYLELIAEVPFVLDALWTLPAETRHAITPHALRTSRGMREYVRRIGRDGLFHVTSIEDLRRYCHVVAGIVGEMLTDTFILGWPPLSSHRAKMVKGSNRFGEGLQLVNILRDAADDRKANRVYLPANADVAAIYAIARDGLQAGAEYIVGLQDGGAPKGFMTFLVVPLFLGWATLELVQQQGSGAKVSRELVAAVMRAAQTNFGDAGPRYTAADLRDLYDEVTGTPTVYGAPP